MKEIQASPHRYERPPQDADTYLDIDKSARLAAALEQQAGKNIFLRDAAGYLQQCAEECAERAPCGADSWTGNYIEHAPAQLAEYALNSGNWGLAETCFAEASPICQWKMAADAYKDGHFEVCNDWYEAASQNEMTPRTAMAKAGADFRILVQQYSDSRELLGPAPAAYYQHEAAKVWEQVEALDEEVTTIYDFGSNGVVFHKSYFAEQASAAGLLEYTAYLHEDEAEFFKAYHGALSKQEKKTLKADVSEAKSMWSTFHAHAILGLNGDTDHQRATQKMADEIQARTPIDRVFFRVSDGLRRGLALYRPDLYKEWQLHQIPGGKNDATIVALVKEASYQEALSSYREWAERRSDRTDLLLHFALELAPHAEEITIQQPQLWAAANELRDILKHVASAENALSHLPAELRRNNNASQARQQQMQEFMNQLNELGDAPMAFVLAYEAYSTLRPTRSDPNTLLNLRAKAVKYWEVICHRPGLADMRAQLQPYAEELGLA